MEEEKKWTDEEIRQAVSDQYNIIERGVYKCVGVHCEKEFNSEFALSLHTLSIITETALLYLSLPVYAPIKIGSLLWTNREKKIKNSIIQNSKLILLILSLPVTWPLVKYLNKKSKVKIYIFNTFYSIYRVKIKILF